MLGLLEAVSYLFFGACAEFARGLGWVGLGLIVKEGLVGGGRAPALLATLLSLVA